MKTLRSLGFAILCASVSTGFSADAPHPSAATVILPPAVAGYPVGWCIRARAEVFTNAKSAGFEYVELALQDVLSLSDEDFQKLTGELQKLNLRALSGYNSIPRELKLVGAEVDQAKLDEHLNRLISRAGDLKLTYLIMNSGGSWRVPEDFSREKAFEQLAEFGRRFAEAARQRGLTVLVQPLRGTDSNLITNVAEAVKLVETVKHPNFAMMVDYSFLTIQKEDPRELLAAGKHLRHVHISNPAANRTYAMGDGESDYAAFFAVLKQIGYRGGLSVHGGPLTTFTNDAPKAITFLRGKAEELAR